MTKQTVPPNPLHPCCIRGLGVGTQPKYPLTKDKGQRTKDSIDRPVAVDLFAGAGGFSLGVEQAGFDVAIAVENDPVHAAVYRFNFPQTRVLCVDIATLQASQLRAFLNQDIDLLFGGPPCQGFSIAGKHDLKDDRNRLIFHFCRLVKELRPRYFAMENVPGLMQGNNKTLLRRLKRELRASGYRITEPVRALNAADFGVPQVRSRLFLLGTRADEHRVSYPQPNPERRVSVRDAIADLPDVNEFTELETGDEVLLNIGRVEQLQKKASFYARQLRELGLDADNFASPRQWNPHLLTSSWRTLHASATLERFRNLPPGEQDRISRLRRLDWEGRCLTLRAGTGSERGAHTAARPLHPQCDRVISVREAARLHSFPDWFRLHVTKWHGFREVGNAVPPLLARAIARQVLLALEIVPTTPTDAIALGDPDWLRFTPKQAQRYWDSR
ncbi:MAG: DNA cytosine methyltransferase [Cyanobacteriota bacterium]|nr:DNA cytosine methyltransferase [Cyanobacteriota bacterium]